MTALSAPPNGPTATASNPPTDPGLRRRAVVRRTRRLAGRRVAETGQGTQRGTFARLRFSTAPLEPDLETDPRRGTIRQFLVKVGQTKVYPTESPRPGKPRRRRRLCNRRSVRASARTRSLDGLRSRRL